MAGPLEHYEQLTAYLDGELSGAERAEVERLLERDAEARALLEELRETARLIGTVPKEFAGMGFNEAVRARLERSSLLDEVTSRRMNWWKPMALAASLVIVCTIGYFGMEKLQKERERQVFALADKEEPGRPVVKSLPSETALAFHDAGGKAVTQEQVATAGRRDESKDRSEFGMMKAAPASPSADMASRRGGEAPRAAPAFGVEKTDGEDDRQVEYDHADARATRPASAALPVKAARSMASASRPVTSQPSSRPVTTTSPSTQPTSSQASDHGISRGIDCSFDYALRVTTSIAHYRTSTERVPAVLFDLGVVKVFDGVRHNQAQQYCYSVYDEMIPVSPNSKNVSQILNTTIIARLSKKTLLRLIDLLEEITQGDSRVAVGNNAEVPMTLSEFRKSVAASIRVSQEDSELPDNDTVMLMLNLGSME